MQSVSLTVGLQLDLLEGANPTTAPIALQVSMSHAIKAIAKRLWHLLSGSDAAKDAAKDYG